MYRGREPYNPKTFELGKCEPKLFKAAQKLSVTEDRLKIDQKFGKASLYLWMSSTEQNTYIYPARVSQLGTHEESGLPAVRFCILNPQLDPIWHVHGLFLDGKFLNLANGMPFYKQEPDGSRAEITDGYFTTETGIELSLIKLDLLGEGEAPVVVQPVPEPAPEPVAAESLEVAA